MLGGGFITFLLSKELWVVEHMFTEFVAFWMCMFVIVKKFGPGIRKYFEKHDNVSNSLTHL